jgi:putative transcriptional regulator
MVSANSNPVVGRGLPLSLVHLARARFNGRLTPAHFAAMLGVSPRTLEQWEQGRRTPSGAAKTLIRVAVLHPEVLREIAA